MTRTDLQEMCYEFNMRLASQNLVILNFGNASVFDAESGLMGIKPSGILYSEMTVADIVILNLEGQIIWGERRPSSDTKTHLELFKAFPGISSVVHTHSTYATAWAQAGLDIPLLGTTHADFAPQAIPCTSALSPGRITDGDYERETGLKIVETFRERNIAPAETPMVNVYGHGPFSWSSGKNDAVKIAIIMEQIAKMAYLTKVLNPMSGVLQSELIEKHFYRKHGAKAYYGQVD